MKVSKILFILVLFCAILSPVFNSYAASTKLNIEGRLTTTAGTPLPNGDYVVTFKIYLTDKSANPLWFDTFAAIKVVNGAFNVTLGSQKALTPSMLYPDKPILPGRVTLFNPESRWLEVVVNGEALFPRVKINASGYAANADNLDGLDSTKFSLTTHNHTLQNLTGVLLDTQIPATITRDTEMKAGLATKAGVVHAHDDRYYTKAEMDALAARVAALEALLQDVTRKGDDITFSGVNVHIVNGQGSTTTANGLGNLIVGYNELRDNGTDDRTGSHYIVSGSYNNYTAYGGLVAGALNTAGKPYASVSGGYGNAAMGWYASVSGGRDNAVSGVFASVSGGHGNTASGNYASVSGGIYNKATGNNANVSGGYGNEASGENAGVSGGMYNMASVINASVSGGYKNEASGEEASVSGGIFNKATGKNASVSGGYSNEASGENASVSAGSANIASGKYASVGGGDNNHATGLSASVSGGSANTASGDYAGVSGGNAHAAMGEFDWRAGTYFSDN